MKANWKWLSLSLLVIMIFSACNPINSPTKTQESPTAVPPTETKTVKPPQPTEGVPAMGNASFAQYVPVSYTLPGKFESGYTLPLEAGMINNLNELDLSATQMEALLKNGFIVLPPANDPNKMYTEFYQAYEYNRYNNVPVFITTDSIFHVYHLVFDKMLRDLEANYFISTLKDLTSVMVTTSRDQYDQLKGTSLEEIAGRNLAYFAVASNLLGTKVDLPANIQSLVDAELALINEHTQTIQSPIWYMGNEKSDEILIEDYSQYTPRGHYTRNDDFKQYFKAMMWYGRMTYRLKNSAETQRALLMIQALRSAKTSSGKTAIDLWQSIYDPTVFIVGKADDLSFREYGEISDQVFGETPNLASFADKSLLDQFTSLAKKLPPPQINSMWVWIWQDRNEATQGFRFMGQRFTLDQYIFGQVMWRKVGTLEQPRDLPKSLDFLAAMGSDEAYKLLIDMGENKYLNYETQSAKVKTEVSGLGLDSWTQNLYWSWLYALQPLFAVKGEQYPAFMQTQAWLHKDMQTALASWTELKHDTILYAKQVMAEMGGGPDSEPPKGYVEPNPEAYARLLALAQMTKSGLKDRNLLDDVTGGNLDNLIEYLQFLMSVTQKEMNGEKLTDDEYWRINYYGGWLEATTLMAADPADNVNGRGDLNDQKSALVADVATGVGRVLEEGVGYPTIIYVVSPEAPYHVTYGAVYTYYEFTVPPDQRMTDEQWRALIESGNAPDAPEWTSTFIIK
jgi:hypothetical protein